MGDFPNAIKAFETSSLIYGKDPAEVHQRSDELRRGFSAGGARGYWEKRWDLIQSQPTAYYERAVIKINLGNTNEALKLLERCYEIREGVMEHHLDYLVFDEYWDGVRDHPRFKELLQKVGFTKVARPQR
jgi:hypothetical protein